jgi:tetratricopeptide (TPR) repeat protein
MAATQAALEVVPDFWLLYMYRGYNFWGLKRYPEAVVAFEKARRMNPESTINLSGLGGTYAMWGRREQALAMIEQLVHMSEHQYVAPTDIAYIYGALGDRDHAMEYLERGYQDRSQMMLYLKMYGGLGGLSSDPRFQQLMRRVWSDRT